MGAAVDDTQPHRTGRCIRQAFHQRDPLSPPFHTNLMLGLRFLQASLLVPLRRPAARMEGRKWPQGYRVRIRSKCASHSSVIPKDEE